MRQYHNPNKGAVKLAQNYTEYAYNYSTSATTDTTSFAWGKEGVFFRNFAPTGTTFVEKRVRFRNPILDDDIIIVEVNIANTKWTPIANNGASIGNFVSNEAGTVYVGVSLTTAFSSDNRDISVQFYSKPFISPSGSWSNQNNNRWRVRKVSTGNFAESPQVNPSITVTGDYTVQHGIETVNVSADEASILLDSMIPSDRVTIRKLGDDATQYIGIYPPSGTTIEGRSELRLYGQYSYAILERVSETVFAIKDKKDEYSITPTVSFNGNSVGVSYLAQVGEVCALKNQVLVNVRVSLTSKGSSTGRFQVNLVGAPTSKSTDSNITPASCTYAFITSTGFLQAYNPQGTNQILFESITDAGVATSIINTAVSNSTVILLSVSYPI